MPLYWRRMRVLLAIFALLFLATSLATPTMGAGWFWDAGNGLGFAAFAGLLYLTLTSNPRINLREHQSLGYGVFLITVLHAFWFILGDAAVAEFMKLGAPDYMWHGIISVLLLGILITVALTPDRFRLYKDYTGFKYWHRVIAIITIGTATYHIAASNFYLGTWYQVVLFVLLTIAVVFGRTNLFTLRQMDILATGAYLCVAIVFAVVFTVIRNMPA